MTSMDMSPSEFFVTGGALSPDSPSYVRRPVDDELFNLALVGEFCYGLTARQMGKSSLMSRTAQRLRAQGVSSVVIDLTTIGRDISTEQWYLGLLTHLKDQLKLTMDLESWWQARDSLGAVQRFITFLHDVVLVEIGEPVVIFIDEIDTTLSLSFSDDFFAAIRSIYNARATDPVYNRLTFVLFGVATPGDLIKDRSRTPFNIGQKLDLREFSREEAQVLQQGLRAFYPEQSEAIFSRIFYWTYGHPYLTQKLCRMVVETENGSWTEEQIDQLVEKLFLSEEARTETNIQFVRDQVQASPQRRQLLALYRQVHERKVVAEDERSFEQNRLKLLGLVRVENGVLRIRNEIYCRAFDLKWIDANTPTDRTPLVIVGLLAAIFLLILGIGFSAYRQRQQTIEARATTAAENFRIPSADVRLDSLAELFGLPGYEAEARRLFYEELGLTEQLALFDLADPQAVEAQLVTVVKGLYTDPRITDEDSQLLKAMGQPLSILCNMGNPTAENLNIEVENWLQGRELYTQGEYQQAIDAYDFVIGLSDQNPGTYFDRGLSHAALGEPDQALADFEAVLSLSESWRECVRQVVVSDDRLYAALWGGREAYRAIVALVPTPTNTPTRIPTNTLSPPIPPTATPFGGGKQIAFYSNRDIRIDVYVMNTDGSNQTPLTNTPANDWEASWSPDGKHIVFSSNRDGNNEIYIMSNNGDEVTRLTNNPADDWTPDWSPDGKQIAFMSERDGNKEIYVMNTDGTQVTRLTDNSADDTAPSWSPDGKRIAFSSRRDDNWEIYVMNADGSEQTNLTNHPLLDQVPSWSPDGKRIAFRSSRDGNAEIYLMNADGSGLTRLTNNSAWDSFPSWSPDSKHIAFASDRDGKWEIYLMNTDGTQVTRLTDNSADDTAPSWSPR